MKLLLNSQQGFHKELVAGERGNFSGEYCERGSMSEYKIVIGYHTLAGEFCVVNGYFSNLRCLMNTLSQSVLPEGGGLMEVQLYQENVSLFCRNLVQFQYFVFSPKQAIVHPIPRLSLILTQLIFKASVKPELLYFYQAENPLPISMHFLFSPVNLFK